jgi:hypothetical protein
MLRIFKEITRCIDIKMCDDEFDPEMPPLICDDTEVKINDIKIESIDAMHLFKISEGDKCVTAIVYKGSSPKIVIYNDTEAQVFGEYPSITNGQYCSAAVLTALADKLNNIVNKAEAEAQPETDDEENEVQPEVDDFVSDDEDNEDDEDDTAPISLWTRLKLFFENLYTANINDRAVVSAN